LEEKLAKVYLALPGRVNGMRNQPLYNSVTVLVNKKVQNIVCGHSTVIKKKPVDFKLYCTFFSHNVRLTPCLPSLNSVFAIFLKLPVQN
jgi:hypothetical protein